MSPRSKSQLACALLGALAMCAFGVSVSATGSTACAAIPPASLGQRMASLPQRTLSLEYGIGKHSSGHSDTAHFDLRISLEEVLSAWQGASCDGPTWDVELVLPEMVGLYSGLAVRTEQSWDADAVFEIEFLEARRYNGSDPVRQLSLHIGEQSTYSAIFLVRVYNAGSSNPVTPGDSSDFWHADGRFALPVELTVGYRDRS